MAGPRLSIRIDLASGKRIGPGKIALMEAIRSTGSISAGARALGMSYRRAWLLVEEINHALREPAVTAETGGRSGGVRPLRPSASGLSVSTGPLRPMRGQRRAESFARWESWFGPKRRRLESAQPHGSGLHKKFGFLLRQAAHGWLVASAVTALSVSTLAAASAREVIDSAGRKVQVPDRVERVVAAGPPASVLVVMLAPEKLVGWNLKPLESELAFLPPVVRNLPEIGRLTGRGGTANLEVVMAAKPDVILDFGSVNATYVSLADRVQAQTRIPYILIGGRFDETVGALRTVGSIFGVPERAELLARRTETIFDETERVVRSTAVTQHPRVYLARRANGLESGNRGSINTEIIERAGGVNVVDAGRENGGLVNVSLEQILQWNPDTIITTDSNFTDKVKTEPVWSNVEAVRRGRVFLSPSLPYGWIDGPPSLNRILGLQWLVRLFFPDRFQSDIRNESRNFYKLFYQVDVTDAQLDGLLEGAK
jgi:iron complex transport system substrate-binding protein